MGERANDLVDSLLTPYSASPSVAWILMSRGLGPLKMTFNRTYFDASSLRVNLSTRSVGAMATQAVRLA